MLRFDKDEMMRYFEPERADDSGCGGFDYIDYKYRHLLRGFEDAGIGEFVPILNKLFVQYERSKTHNLYEKIDYSEIYERLKLIYADPREAESFVFLYDFALDHLLDRYINIPILNKLFSHHFFEYEWEQHVDMNFEKNELSFYRDHFIHQIRNCYMILKYLDYSDCDLVPGGSASNSTETYYEKIESVLKERTSEISKYACSHVEQYVEYVKSKITSFAQRNTLSSTNDEKKEIVEKTVLENVESFSWNYLIRGSLVIAALFHDIGYPIRYTYKSIDSVSEYMSSIVPSDNVGFDRLNDLLEGSLLFTVTDKKEMRARYDSLDHGALSAYMLLLQVYETGAIHSLNPVKKAMIELAAVIVYDHTLKYSSIGDSRDKYRDEIREKPSFKDNPLTYTLRFVDDLQEWDRLYFEINGERDLVYCEKCRMPMVDMWDDFQINDAFDSLQFLGDSNTSGYKPADVRRKHRASIINILNGAKAGSDMEEYFSLDYTNDSLLKGICVCGCDTYTGDKNQPYYSSVQKAREAIENKINGHLYTPGPIENGSIFKSQRINYTMTCDSVVLLRDNHGDIFYIDYNPFSLLYLLTVNHRALEYRIAEIAKLNKQFGRQSGIDIRMRTHITDNPMMLKMRIMCDFLYELGTYINIDPKFEKSRYKRNMVYYEMVKDTMPSPTREARVKWISRFVSSLRCAGFLAYDYRNENIYGESSPLAAQDYQGFKSVLNTMFPAVVDLLIRNDVSVSGVFKSNLINTLKAYVEILSVSLQAAQKNDDSGWLDLCTMENNPKCQFAYIDDDHKRACGMIYRDCVSQLYYQSKGDMERYYELRGKSGERARKEKFWSDPDFVIGEDEMAYALGIVFQKKYYNPSIIRGRTVNSGKIDFFDIYSDMYLFKEMNRFTVDNRKRRHGPIC